MKHFLLYNLFSGFEFFALMTFIVVLFKFRESTIRQTLIATAALTWSSYVMVIFKVHESVPLPVFLVPIQIILLYTVYNIKLRLSVVSATLGTLCYGGVVQGITSFICIKTGYLTSEDLLITFAVKSYIMQSLGALILLVVSFYIRYFNEGFDISLNRKHPYGFFILANIIALLMILTTFYGFTLDTTEAYIVLYLLMGVLGSSFLIYNVRKIEKHEFM